MNDYIRQALETALNTWSLDQSTVVPIAWPNKSYTPTIGTKYIKANILTAETENPSLGDDHKRYPGIFQLLLYMPDNKGSGDATRLADNLCEEFKRGKSFTASTVTVRILNSPSVLPSFNDNGWYVLPVSIRYQSDIF